jgi:hypothetical protein
MVFQGNQDRIEIRTLLSLKDLINYSKQGKLKILSYKKKVLIDRIIKSQIRRYLASDLSCQVVDRNYCSINLNLIYFLKTMENQKNQLGVNNEVIHLFLDCAIACEECAILCLNEDNPGMMARCMALTRDCAESCFQAIKLAIRNSESLSDALAFCEALCHLCAAECRKHQVSHCQSCAENCELCADACREQYERVKI